MQQHIEVQYWRHPWRNVLIISLVNIFILAFRLLSSLLVSNQYGQVFQLDAGEALMYGNLLVCLLCFNLHHLSKSIRHITLSEDRVLFSRRLGRTITAYVHEIHIRKDVLYIGRRLTIPLDGMINMEQIEDMLAPHAGALTKGLRFLRLISGVFTAALLAFTIAFPVIAVVIKDQLFNEGWLVVYAAALCAFTAAYLVLTIHNLTIK